MCVNHLEAMMNTKFYLKRISVISARISQSAIAADVVGQVGTVNVAGSAANVPANRIFGWL